jgi:homocitrate synthase NifV
MRQTETLVRSAAGHFDRVSVGAQDATRADSGFLRQVAALVKEAGGHRLRIADTVGISRPAAVGELIRSIKAAVPDLELEFHGHNDLGMATANALSALEAGAESVSVTVNALGERAGNAALEQVVMALAGHPDLTTSVDTTRLLPLCRLVALASCQQIPPSQPVVGERVFTHESGIHCHAMFKDTRAYEPFEPSRVGRIDRRFVLGTHSGASAIVHLLAQAGIQVSSSQARNLRPFLARIGGCS